MKCRTIDMIIARLSWESSFIGSEMRMCLAMNACARDTKNRISLLFTTFFLPVLLARLTKKKKKRMESNERSANLEFYSKAM